jgi:hypothetical protein
MAAMRPVPSRSQDGFLGLASRRDRDKAGGKRQALVRIYRRISPAHSILHSPVDHREVWPLASVPPPVCPGLSNRLTDSPPDGVTNAPTFVDEGYAIRCILTRPNYR